MTTRSTATQINKLDTKSKTEKGLVLRRFAIHTTTLYLDAIHTTTLYLDANHTTTLYLDALSQLTTVYRKKRQHNKLCWLRDRYSSSSPGCLCRCPRRYRYPPLTVKTNEWMNERYYLPKKYIRNCLVHFFYYFNMKFVRWKFEKNNGFDYFQPLETSSTKINSDMKTNRLPKVGPR